MFARYTSPVESMLRYRIWDVEVPLALSGTLTSQVRLDSAKEVEDKVRAEIRRGMPVKDVEAKYGRL